MCHDLSQVFAGRSQCAQLCSSPHTRGSELPFSSPVQEDVSFPPLQTPVRVPPVFAGVPPEPVHGQLCGQEQVEPPPQECHICQEDVSCPPCPQQGLAVAVSPGDRCSLPPPIWWPEQHASSSLLPGQACRRALQALPSPEASTEQAHKADIVSQTGEASGSSGSRPSALHLTPAERLRFLTFETDAANTLAIPPIAGASAPSRHDLRTLMARLLLRAMLLKRMRRILQLMDQLTARAIHCCRPQPSSFGTLAETGVPLVAKTVSLNASLQLLPLSDRGRPATALSPALPRLPLQCRRFPAI